MPKRPKLNPIPPEVGDIWRDCYDWLDERYYLLLERVDWDEGIAFDALDLYDGTRSTVNMADWRTSWIREG